MPTYEYVCEACEHEWELEQRMVEDAAEECPKCEKPKAKRLISAGRDVLQKGAGLESHVHASTPKSRKLELKAAKQEAKERAWEESRAAKTVAKAEKRAAKNTARGVNELARSESLAARTLAKAEVQEAKKTEQSAKERAKGQQLAQNGEEASPPDPDGPTRACLLEAIALVGAPAPSPSAGRKCASKRLAALELRDPEGAAILTFRPADASERARARPASPIDQRLVESLLAQIPQVAFSGLLLGQMAGQIVLQVTPELAAQIASGTAKYMVAATGGLRGNIVNAATNAVIGQATFAPASLATLGAAAGWQLLSFLVAQKHLYDINARLDRIEHLLDELREQMDQDLFAEIWADAEHLSTYVRALGGHGDGGTGEAQKGAVNGIVREARVRHKKLLGRLTTAEKKFTLGRSAKWFSRSMNTAAQELHDDVDRLSRVVVALRLNALVFAAAIEVLHRLGEAASWTDALGKDVELMATKDDAQLTAIFGHVQDSVMGLKSIFRKELTDVSARLRVAERVKDGAMTAGTLREEFDRVRGNIERETPQLLLHVGEGRALTSVAWLDSDGEFDVQRQEVMARR